MSRSSHLLLLLLVERGVSKPLTEDPQPSVEAGVLLLEEVVPAFLLLLGVGTTRERSIEAPD